MDVKEVKKEIRKLKKDPNSLSNFLINLAKQFPESKDYVDLYKELLDCKNPDVKSAVIYGLLFTWKDRDINCINLALSFVENKRENFDVRGWSATALGQIFMNSKNIIVMKVLIQRIYDEKDDSLQRGGFMRSLLNIWGVSSLEQLKRFRYSVIDWSDEVFKELLTEYKSELTEIEKYLRQNIN